MDAWNALGLKQGMDPKASTNTYTGGLNGPLSADVPDGHPLQCTLGGCGLDPRFSVLVKLGTLGSRLEVPCTQAGGADRGLQDDKAFLVQ